jgi:hypothetical protein
VHGLHAAASKVVNSAQGLSCKLKFVHALAYLARALIIVGEKSFPTMAPLVSKEVNFDNCELDTNWNNIRRGKKVSFTKLLIIVKFRRRR